MTYFKCFFILSSLLLILMDYSNAYLVGVPNEPVKLIGEPVVLPENVIFAGGSSTSIKYIPILKNSVSTSIAPASWTITNKTKLVNFVDTDIEFEYSDDFEKTNGQIIMRGPGKYKLDIKVKAYLDSGETYEDDDTLLFYSDVIHDYTQAQHLVNLKAPSVGSGSSIGYVEGQRTLILDSLHDENTFPGYPSNVDLYIGVWSKTSLPRTISLGEVIVEIQVYYIAVDLKN